MAAFVGVLAISSVAYTKILLLGSFTFNREMTLFPPAYIFGDILTEVYGYQKSWRVNWTSLFWAFTAAAAFSAVGALSSAPGYALGADFHAILGQTPWIIASDPLAYFTGGFTSSYVPAKMKTWASGRRLWTRTIGSTLVGEGLDTVVFLTAALLRSLPGRLPAAVFISNQPSKWEWKRYRHLSPTPLLAFSSGASRRTAMTAILTSAPSWCGDRYGSATVRGEVLNGCPLV